MASKQREKKQVDEYLSNTKPSRNQKLISGYITHRMIGKPIAGKRKRAIDERTAYKTIIWLDHASKWIGKDFDKVNEADLDLFRTRLKRDYFKKKDGTPYKVSVKRDIEYKILRPFLQWQGKDELNLIFDEYKRIEELQTFKREEIERASRSLPIRDACILLTLFDSGFRPGELLSLTFASVNDEGGDFIKIRCLESKTRARTVSIPIATNILRAWITQHKDLKGTNNPIFDITYESLNMILHRIGRAYFKKPISTRTLRHSSATYYSHLLSHSQLCRRYGWSMASAMPKVYIDREGIDEDETGDKVVNVDNTELKRENQQLKERLAKIEDEQKEYAATMERLVKKLEKIGEKVGK